MDIQKLDADLDTLKQRAPAWLALDLDARIEYLKSMLDGTFEVAEEQVAAAIQAKRVPAGTAMEAEDYLAGPVVQGRTIGC